MKGMPWIALVALVVLLAAIPLAAGEYYINLASQILIAAIFAASLNLLVGYGGLPSLGHAAWLGLAAYVWAWMTLKAGLGHWATAPVALLATTLVAGRIRLDLAARKRSRIPDAHARAFASAVGYGLPLGCGDGRRQRLARPRAAIAFRHRSQRAPLRSITSRCS